MAAGIVGRAFYVHFWGQLYVCWSIAIALLAAGKPEATGSAWNDGDGSDMYLCILLL